MTRNVFTQLSLPDKKNASQARINMIKQQIRTWDVLDEHILSLFYQVDRQDFVPEKYKKLAFADFSIPLPQGQSMLAPKEEAKILQSLHIHAADKILLIGVETGYLITLLSRLGGKVYYINNDLDSCEKVKQKVAEHKLPNVTFLMGNVEHGWQDLLPFNIILLTGSLPAIPLALKDALATHGRLFIVTGKEPAMEAMLVQRLSENTWSEKKLFETIRPRMLDVKEPHLFTF